MFIVCDPAFDDGSHPGPGNGGEAAVGEAWVGVGGLVGTLETVVGLTAARPSAAERAAGLVPRVRKTHGFWSESAKADELSTARRLLELYESLSLGGWEGQPVSPRLAALAGLIGHDEHALGARLAALAKALPRFERPVDVVELLVARQALPWRLQQVLTVLEGRGVNVHHRALTAARVDTGCDLARLRKPGATPTGDGTVQLLRPYGWLAAADAVAAALAATPETSTVILGGDRVLDAALRRHGLPTTGGAGAQHDNALLQVLPLVLAVGAAPIDPRLALELVLLPASPVPASTARRLARALQRQPAVDGDLWREALAEALADTEPARRASLERRLSDLFTPCTTAGEAWPTQALLQRVELVRGWLLGHREHEPDTALVASLDAALAQVNAFTSLVRAVERRSLPPALIHRLLEQATDAAPAVPLHRSQAGVTALGGPGSLAGPTPRVVWWTFTRDSVAPPREFPLTTSEKTALAAAGVHLPSAAQRAAAMAEAWSRPFLQAAEALWLVCPQHLESGDEAEPHPAWDEVLARLESPRLAATLTFTEPQAPVTKKKRRRWPLPAPRATWDAGRDIPRRVLESPSSLQDFLGCELAWTLRYAGGLRFGRAGGLDEGPQLLGTMTHELLARVLRRLPLPPAGAERLALTLFDEEGPRLAAALFLPGVEAERAAARESTGASARWLAQLVSSGWKVELVEEPVRGTGCGGALEGTVDLVLSKGKAKAVVDLKYGSGAHYRDSLARGTSVQLAAYAALLREGGAKDVSAGYFILRTQQLFSADARLADPPLDVEVDVATTWQAVTEAHGDRWARVKRGRVTAPGARDGAPEQSSLKDGVLTVAPPCHFCDYQGVCGRLYGREAADGED
jgi:ATP-dependent helicase/nuclease subunit B